MPSSSTSTRRVRRQAPTRWNRPCVDRTMTRISRSRIPVAYVAASSAVVAAVVARWRTRTTRGTTMRRDRDRPYSGSWIDGGDDDDPTTTAMMTSPRPCRDSWTGSTRRPHFPPSEEEEEGGAPCPWSTSSRRSRG
jgi:hypothetical protein